MAEALSPNPNPNPNPKPRPVFASPTSPFFLGSNNDNLERAQARAARAASVRRKSVVATTSFSDPPPSVLDELQIRELLNNCLKLATENKITQKNTWELNLIDHLHDVIKIEEEDTETNFQKASCTLEAGVKIYALRVDSVHAEAYKVLGGINRVGQEHEDNILEDASNGVGQEGGTSKKEKEKKCSPLATLESSFETLNVKKFDVAFSVDPLYHQTTAQFDEGGAKGLLLNNLGVYGDCRVLFDSQEVPGNCATSIRQTESTETIDLSFARECIEQMVYNMSKDCIISPSLAYIIDQFGESNKRRTEVCSASQLSSDLVEETFSNNNASDRNENEDYGTWTMDQDDQTDGVDEGAYADDPSLPDQHEDKESFSYHETDQDDRFEEVDGFLSFSLGFSSKHNAWAGPEHWKYRKSKVTEEAPDETTSPVKSKKMKIKKAESDISFMTNLDSDMSNIFAPPKNSKSILLHANREIPCTKLPEDCHYQPEDLVKLFLRPDMMCLGKRGRRNKYVPNQGDGYEATSSWDEDDGYHGGDCFDDRDASSDVDDSNTLVSQPRQVSKIEVQYDKTSKQVDVQALKKTLWNHIQEPSQSYQQERVISFSEALSSFPSDCLAAASLADISPHLCFICLLHLANEHGLRIEGCAGMDDLRIYIQAKGASED